MNLTSNDAGKNQFQTKLMRAIKRSPKLIQQFLSSHQPITVEDVDTGVRQRTIAMEVDMNRFYSAMKMLSRALYFHHYGEKWLGPITAHADFLMALGSDDDVGTNELAQTMALAADEFFKDKEVHGMNKDVFNYQVFNGNEKCCQMFRLHFYDESRVLVCFGLED